MSHHIRMLALEGDNLSRADVSAIGEQLELAAEPVRPNRARGAVRDTSRAARTQNRASSALCDQIYAAIAEAARDPRRQGATADEVHETIAATETERADVRRLMNVRRRISDLAGVHRIRATILHRMNAGGYPQIVWAPANDASAAEGNDVAR